LAGCAALGYHTGMLFRSIRLMLAAAGSVLVFGCHGPQVAEVSHRARSSSSHTSAGLIRDSRAEPARVQAHAHYAQGVLYAAQEDMARALDEFYAAATNDPSNESLVLEVSRDFLETGQAQKALALLKEASAQPNASGEIFAELGSVYYQLLQLDSATNADLIAIKKNPRLLSGYANLFAVYAQNKQPAQAAAVLDKAAKISGADAEFLIGLGELYSKFGARFADQKKSADARATELFQRASKLNPKEPELRMRLADGLSSIGKYDEAAGIYLDLLKTLPDAPFVREGIRAKLGEIYPNIKNTARITELLEAFIRENPTDARAYYLLGSMAYEATNYAKASEYFSQTILLNPDFEPAYADLAGAQLAQNKNAEAQVTLASGLKKFPHSFVLEYLSGMADNRQKDYAGAVKHFTAAEIIAQATDPKRLKDFFYFQFGSACERLGDLAQAEKYFEKCLQLSPNFDEAQNYLGYMWAEHGTNLDRARDLIEKAVKADPKNSAYLDSMAWVLFKLNQPRQALDYELKAMANSEEEDAELYDHLGDIYSALGQKQKARDAWRKSLRLESNDEVRKKLEQ
jgi:tetratricopeptide (TPR) repeat protein